MATQLLDTLTAISDSNNYNLWMYNNIKDHLAGTLLDIGSGIGNIARSFVTNNRISKVILSDKEEIMVTRLNEKFSHMNNCSVVNLDICNENCMERLPQGPMDTITALNLLEHIKDDVLALKNMRKLLRKKGTLVTITPAVPSIYGTLDEITHHYRRYGQKALSEKLKQAGFIIKKQYYMNLFGIVTWALAGKVLRQRRFHGKTAKFLDRGIPFFEKMERIYPPCIGQSLISICEA